MRITLIGLLAAICFLLVPCVPIVGNYAIVCGPSWLKEGAVLGTCICSGLVLFGSGILFAALASEGK